LGCRSGELQAALLAATLRTCSISEAQHVSSTPWALAKLDLSLSDELQAVLLPAISRVSEQMIGQNAANTIWALAGLGMQPGAEAQRALCDALVRNARAAPLKSEEAHMTRRGLAKLQLPVGAELDRALARTAA
jgi:hypothetical protein